MKRLVFVPKAHTIEPMNKKQLREFFGLSKYALRKWLDALQTELGEPVSGIYSVRQVQILIDRYGLPGSYMERDVA